MALHAVPTPLNQGEYLQLDLNANDYNTAREVQRILQRTFEIADLTLYKRLTLVAEDARVVKVFYPVFPPDANAGDVLRWLRAR